MKDRIIYLDMDGVLADFPQALSNHLSLPLKNLSDYNYRELHKVFGMTRDEFVERIHHIGLPFWTSIPLTPWAKNLVQSLATLDLKIKIMSTSLETAGCEEGKFKWVKTYFPELSPPILSDEKHLNAHPRALLIDDDPNNWVQFLSNGGHAILFPQPYNKTLSFWPTRTYNNVISETLNWYAMTTVEQ